MNAQKFTQKSLEAIQKAQDLAKAKEYLINNGYDEVYGARPLKRFGTKKLETLIAEKILKQEISPSTKVTIDCNENKLIVK